MCTVELIIPTSPLSPRRFSIHEAISSPFTVSIWARSEDPGITMESVVGKPASFRIETGYAHVKSGGTRSWEGICSHFQQLKAVIVKPGEKVEHTYHVRIVPRLWLLTQRRNYFVFQHETIPDIVKKILAFWKIEAVACQCVLKYCSPTSS